VEQAFLLSPAVRYQVHVDLADHVKSPEPMTILQVLALVEGEHHTEDRYDIR
jgi:hypothetical protein